MLAPLFQYSKMPRPALIESKGWDVDVKLNILSVVSGVIESMDKEKQTVTVRYHDEGTGLAPGSAPGSGLGDENTREIQSGQTGKFNGRSGTRLAGGGGADSATLPVGSPIVSRTDRVEVSVNRIYCEHLKCVKKSMLGIAKNNDVYLKLQLEHGKELTTTVRNGTGASATYDYNTTDRAEKNSMKWDMSVDGMLQRDGQGNVMLTCSVWDHNTVSNHAMIGMSQGIRQLKSIREGGTVVEEVITFDEEIRSNDKKEITGKVTVTLSIKVHAESTNTMVRTKMLSSEAELTGPKGSTSLAVIPEGPTKVATFPYLSNDIAWMKPPPATQTPAAPAITAVALAEPVPEVALVPTVDAPNPTAPTTTPTPSPVKPAITTAPPLSDACCWSVELKGADVQDETGKWQEEYYPATIGNHSRNTKTSP